MENTTLPPLHLHALQAGMRALEILNGQPEATVIGSTSRGLFLLLPGSQVVFLSMERHAGPLTVNLKQDHPRLHAVHSGMAVRVHPKHLEIDKAGVTVDWSEAQGWSPPAPPKTILEREQRLERLRAVTRAALQESQSGILPICGPLLGMDTGADLTDENQSILEKASALRKALAEQDLEGALTALKPLLGLGRGLTPAGDDFVEGLLLALVRFRAQYAPFQPLDELIQSLTMLGYQRTTALSANLIEAAGTGEADERLLDAADGIFAGRTSIEECARDLLSYGSSSGTDALAGMAAAGSV